jgi:HSP20 family protein
VAGVRERQSSAAHVPAKTITYRVVVESERVGRPPQTGLVEEVLSREPPRYRIRWDNGRTSRLAPAAGVARIEPIEKRRKGGDTMSQLVPERRSTAAPERWEPLGELEQMTERMRRMIDQTFGRFGSPGRAVEGAGWVPFVDIEEQDDAFVVEAELPGVKLEDVNVELIGNELMITGELKERERKGIIRRRTRRTGQFEYRVGLPEAVDAEAVEAKLHDGVLTVRAPKSQRAQRRTVDVKS